MLMKELFQENVAECIEPALKMMQRAIMYCVAWCAATTTSTSVHIAKGGYRETVLF